MRIWPFRPRLKFAYVPPPAFAVEAAAARETLDWYLARGEVTRITGLDLVGPVNETAVLTVEVAYRGEPDEQEGDEALIAEARRQEANCQRGLFYMSPSDMRAIMGRLADRLESRLVMPQPQAARASA